MKKLAIAIAMLLPAAALANPESLATLFPLRAQINAYGGDLCRLELPAEVIGACRPDLADLRILGHGGREIPYIVDSPEPVGVATAVRTTASPEILDAMRSRRVVDRVDVYTESYVLGMPIMPDDVPAWDLALTVGKREFVSRVDLTVVGPGGRRTPVVSGGSVFRLPAAEAEKLRFSIPVRDAVRLEIRFESRDTSFLEPRFALEASRFLPVTGTSSVELRTVEISDLPNATELVVDRPRGIVPRRLAITTITGAFHRRVTVWDEGPGADPEPLGRGTVWRVPAIAPVEELEILLRPPRGDRLRLVIENQDSPALENISFSALMPRPVLVFLLPDETPSATLFFGGGRAHRPRYDLAAFQALPVQGEEAERFLTVLDPTRARAATLSAVERNPEYDPAPVLAFAIHPGAEIDPGPYSHRRRLEVTPSAEGLARVRLEPADLAVLRPDLADLRIVDGDGRQWAYLRQDAARNVTTPIDIGPPEIEDGVSRYELTAPEGVLIVDRLSFDTDAPYFDRDFTLAGRFEDGGERVLTRGRLVRRADDPRPPTIGLTSCRVTGLVLEVVDGDDAPLGLRRAEARSSAPDLYLAAEAGDFDLLLGHPDARAPVYELERVRSTILAVPASEVTAGDLEANPAFNAASRIHGGSGIQKLALWGVLGLAVIVLLVVTLRAARQESEA